MIMYKRGGSRQFMQTRMNQAKEKQKTKLKEERWGRVQIGSILEKRSGERRKGIEQKEGMMVPHGSHSHTKERARLRSKRKELPPSDCP